MSKREVNNLCIEGREALRRRLTTLSSWAAVAAALAFAPQTAFAEEATNAEEAGGSEENDGRVDRGEGRERMTLCA